jgi:hypothetical protein
MSRSFFLQCTKLIAPIQLPFLVKNKGVVSCNPYRPGARSTAGNGSREIIMQRNKKGRRDGRPSFASMRFTCQKLIVSPTATTG